MLRKKGFTLIELVLVIIISGSILTTVYGIMTILPKVKNFNDARQNLIQQTNDVMDRFAILFQDYTVDYEEYFNRKMVGCDGTNKGANFAWKVNDDGHCEAFTAYGNENAKLQWASQKHHLQYCSSDPLNGYGELLNSANCRNAGIDSAEGTFPTNNHSKLSYGQYKRLFRDVKNDTDNQSLWGTIDEQKKPREFWDSDDRDLGEWPEAIGDPKNIQELYLISHDGNRRILLRKQLKHYQDLKGKAYTWSTIQILKLRGFDAGKSHDFDAEKDSEVYDGELDTRACDAGQQFRCSGEGVPLYAGYHLPQDKDDGRVDLFDDNLNIAKRILQIAPTKNPDYAWAEADQQINPFIRISLTAKLNDHLWANKLGWSTSGFQYTLQNLYDTKGFYLK